MSTGSSRSYSYSSLSDKDSSILKSIDDILKRDYGNIYAGRYGGLGQYAGHHSGSYYDQLSGHSSSRGSSPSQYNSTAEDLSMQRIASTFSTSELDYAMASATEHMSSDFSPMTTDTDTPPDFTPAMPLLPDLPTKSRRLLEDLGSKSIAEASSAPQPRTSRSGKVDDSRDYQKDSRSAHSGRRHDQSKQLKQQQILEAREQQRRMIQEQPDEQPFSDHTRRSASNQRARQQQAAQQRKAHASTFPAKQKYEFPVKIYLLTRDPKDKSVSGNGLGMKVIGGKEVPGSAGELGAYVAKVYPGGVVDRLGEIREGDQILEWNGTQLKNKTYEAVQTVLRAPSEEVELVIRCDFNMSTGTQRHSRNSDHHRSKNKSHTRTEMTTVAEHHHHRSSHSDSGNHSSFEYVNHSNDISSQPPYDSLDSDKQPYGSSSISRNSIRNPSPCKQDDIQSIHRYSSLDPIEQIGEPQLSIINNNIPPAIKSNSSSSSQLKDKEAGQGGEIQLLVCFDSQADILYVTILRARNLFSGRSDRSVQSPDPFVKCYLLPGRCVENQRRTRYFSRSSNPEWNQTMVYPNVTFDLLNQRYLEVTVWNYDIYRPNEFLGEVILDLSDPTVIDEQARFYKLLPHDETQRPAHILPTSGSSAAMTATTSMVTVKSSESSLSGVSVNGVVGKRMAMVNNKSSSEDSTSKKNFDKKYKSMGRRKSNTLSLSPTNSQNRLKKVPIFPTTNVSAHPLMPQGCHGAV
ncbi:Protein piccolo [Nymphon striatum]|nr:Protein piccolo [Nymphon striatum]